MLNTARAIRRVLILTLISATLIATVVLLLATQGAKASVDQPPFAPQADETWFPATGASFRFTGTARLVATMIPLCCERITVTELTFRVIYPLPLAVYPVVYSTLFVPNVGSSVVVTATDFPFSRPARTVQISLKYVTTSAPTTPVATTVTYSVNGVSPAVYIPSVAIPPLIAGSNPCVAIPANPLVDNVSQQDSPYKFFSLSVPTTSTIYMTVTGYSLSGQMQFRTVPPTCEPTGTQYVQELTVIPGSPSLVALNIPPGNYLARFSSDTGETSNTPFTFRWQYIPFTPTYGANDDSCSAFPVNLNTTYQEYPYKTEEWFLFNIAATQSISVAVNNYAASGGQVELYKQSGTCSSFQFLKAGGFTNNTAVIETVSLTPATYYLRVYSGGGLNINTLYNFRIYTVASLMALAPPVVGPAHSPTPVPIPAPPRQFRVTPAP